MAKSKIITGLKEAVRHARERNMIESLHHEWRVSEKGDIEIIRIRSFGDNCQTNETIVFIPWQAVRCAVANATGQGDGIGRSGRIESE
jgi:hypothetical protein